MKNYFYFAPELQTLCPTTSDPWQYLFNLPGKIVRAAENRTTLYFTHNGQGYYLKRMTPLTVGQYLAEIFAVKPNAMTTANEYRGIQHLQQHGVNTAEIVAYGHQTHYFYRTRSFIITKALENTINLHDFTQQWRHCAPTFNVKKTLIESVATIVKRMHTSGMNHRDCYLLHFLLDKDCIATLAKQQTARIYVLDLHRSQRRSHTPTRWLIKDLSGLYFSSKEISLTRRDYLRFMQVYHGARLRDILPQKWRFWARVKAKGERLYQRRPIA